MRAVGDIAESEPESETERVTREIRDGILDRVRPPGSRLVERELATEMGVSRVPVRAALAALDAEGLVTSRPRTWSIVREFSESDISDLHEVRAAIEALAFRLAAQRHTREGLAQLGVIVEAEVAAANRGDGVTARRAAADFHARVVVIAGNDLLSEIQQTLGVRIRWLLSQYDDLVGVAEEHRALLAAIARRDVESVSTLVRNHMDTGRYLDGSGRSTRAGPQT